MCAIFCEPGRDWRHSMVVVGVSTSSRSSRTAAANWCLLSARSPLGSNMTCEMPPNDLSEKALRGLAATFGVGTAEVDGVGV